MTNFVPKNKIHLWQPLGKYFFISALDSLRAYLAWPVISFLTSQPIYNTFNWGLKWGQIAIFKFAINLQENH